MKSLAVLAGAVLVLLSSTAIAGAQSDGAQAATGTTGAPDAARDEEARHLFEAGATAFRDTRFEDALAYFERSHELSRRDELLYNLGLACERLGRDAEALAYYERFLAALPDTPNRADVESRIALLERREAERAAQGSEPRPEPPPAPGPDPGGVALVVAGGLVAAVGIALVVAGALDQASVENSAAGTPWSSVSGAAERSPILTTVGWVALGLGVAGAAAGVVVLTLPGSGEGTRARLTPGGIVLEGTF